jgi:hypothetical protein
MEQEVYAEKEKLSEISVSVKKKYKKTNKKTNKELQTLNINKKTIAIEKCEEHNYFQKFGTVTCTTCGFYYIKYLTPIEKPIQKVQKQNKKPYTNLNNMNNINNTRNFNNKNFPFNNNKNFNNNKTKNIQ